MFMFFLLVKMTLFEYVDRIMKPQEPGVSGKG